MVVSAALALASFSPYLAVVGMENESVVINVFDRDLHKKTIYSQPMNLYPHPENRWSLSVGAKNEVFRYSFLAVANRKDKVIYLQRVVGVTLSEKDATTVAKCNFQIVKMNYEGKILSIFSFSSGPSEFFVLNAKRSGVLGLYGNDILYDNSRESKAFRVQKLSFLDSEREFSPLQVALAKKLKSPNMIVPRFDESVSPCPEISDAFYPAGEWLNLYTERCSDQIRKANAVYSIKQIEARWGSKELSLEWSFPINHVRMLDYPNVVGKFATKNLTTVEKRYQIRMYPLRNESEIRILNLKDGSFKSLGSGITPIPL